MFDPIKIAAFINKLRKEKDMTQLELAELLKVTPQAVSKWERGEALPDISLLPELAKIFDVTIDSIINGEIREQNVIDKALNEISIGHLDNVTNLLNSKVLKPNDLVTISPLLKTSVVDKVIAESDENLYTIEDIIALAPFASVDLLYNLLAKFEKLDITQFVKLVPFLNFSTIESAFKKVDYQNITKEQIISLAPFLNLHDFNEIVEKNLDLLKEASTIIKIAPFTNHETLNTLIEQLPNEEVSPQFLKQIAPFLSSSAITSLLNKIDFNKIDKNILVQLAPFIDKETLTSFVEKLELSIKDIIKIAPFLNSDIINKIVEKVNNVNT